MVGYQDHGYWLFRVQHIAAAAAAVPLADEPHCDRNAARVPTAPSAKRDVAPEHAASRCDTVLASGGPRNGYTSHNVYKQ